MAGRLRGQAEPKTVTEYVVTAFAVYFNKPFPYMEAMSLQERLVAARISGAIPDVVLFLEHSPVITLGVRARERHVLLPREELVKRDIQVAQTSRGGDVTWHGPGQLVMYPIMKLGEKEEDAHGYLHNLEEIAIRTACDFGVSVFRRKGMTGVWTRPGKLAAIGIRLKRWVTFHGISLNVSPDLSGFEAIVPCGLTGEPVTSLRVLLGQDCPSVVDVRERMTRHFSEVCQRELQQYYAGRSAPSELGRIMAPYASACS